MTQQSYKNMKSGKIQMNENRSEMLNTLKKVEFCYIWPPSDWEDIGFTERPIWVNGLGYGYVVCDDIIGHYAGRGPTEELWERIKLYIEREEVTLESIKGEFLSELIDGLELCDDEEVNDCLKEMVEADIGACNYLLALNGLDETVFMPLDKEEDWNDKFKQYVDRDYADYYWNDMSDEELEEWIKRIYD